MLALALLASPTFALAQKADKSDDASAKDLDKVVVRGMSGATTFRSTSSPISIITSQEIERKQSTNLTDLLRGALPGMSVLNSGNFDWTTKVNARGNTAWNNTGSDLFGDYMKILVDDVEIVRPTLLSMIDPKSIEQIEIVRGPLAGAMYGAEGSSGVMRITTKKGRVGQSPDFIAQIAAGVIESDNKPDGSRPLVVEKSVQMTGGSENLGYRIGITDNDTGEWIDGYDKKARMISGAVQGSYGDFDVSFSALHADTNLSTGFAEYPMSETLLATTLGYEASENWHHTFTAGYDSNRFGYDGYNSKSSDYERKTFRYFTNYDRQLTEDISGRFTLGADLVLYKSYELEGHSHGDGEEDHSHVTAESWRNLGYYGVAELGWRDRLYLTMAGRVEQRLRNVTTDKSPFQPRVGLSYVMGNDAGTTVKLRTQWGTSARAPNGTLLTDSPGIRWSTIAADVIKPEEKVGWDAGFDISWARYGSLSLTYFNEEGRDLVMPVVIQPGNWVFGRPDLSTVEISQYRNHGLVTNKGWELEARMFLGPVSLRANATVADNKIRKLTNTYDGDEIIRVGAQRVEVPKHAGGISATVNAYRGNISLDASWIGPYVPRATDFETDTLWYLGLRTEQAVNDRLTVFGRIDNLLNKNEAYPAQYIAGRTTVLGLRYTF